MSLHMFTVTNKQDFTHFKRYTDNAFISSLICPVNDRMIHIRFCRYTGKNYNSLKKTWNIYNKCLLISRSVHQKRWNNFGIFMTIVPNQWNLH